MGLRMDPCKDTDHERHGLDVRPHWLPPTRCFMQIQFKFTIHITPVCPYIGTREAGAATQLPAQQRDTQSC